MIRRSICKRMALVIAGGGVSWRAVTILSAIGSRPSPTIDRYSQATDRRHHGISDRRAGLDDLVDQRLTVDRMESALRKAGTVPRGARPMLTPI